MDRKDWIACNCEKCREPCQRRPCWGTPEEIQALIDNGYSDRLMLDHWGRKNDKGGNIYILSPAIVGYEKKGTPFMPFGQCTFYGEEDCELHEPNLMPIEGRLITPCQEEYPEGLHEYVAMLWDNPEAQELAHSLKLEPSAVTECLALLDILAAEVKSDEETA